MFKKWFWFFFFFTLDLPIKATWAIFGVDVTNFGSTSGENRGLKLL